MKGEPTVTVAVLLYGDHHELHKRCLDSISKTTPLSVDLRIGFNEVCEETMVWATESLEGADPTAVLHMASTADSNQCLETVNELSGRKVSLYSVGNRNLCKYPMMSRMLGRVTGCPPVRSDYLVWVDDDTWFEDDSPWYRKFMALAKFQSLHYGGECWFVDYLSGQMEMLESMPWYTGKELEIRKAQDGSTKHIVNFATGGFVMIRSLILDRLKWPPPELNHNGGDTLLAEATRQCGYTMTKIGHNAMLNDWKVHVNDAKRRGYHERPLGSTADVRR